MADTKISALTALTTLADDDEFAVVDTSATETKRITWGSLKVLADIGDLGDVVITSVADNEVLAYDSGGNWINQTAAEAGLISGTPGGTDNRIVRANGTGSDVQGSALTIGDDGTLSMADNTIERPVFKDYGETVNAIGSIGGGTQDIDLTSGNVVTGTVDTSTTTFTFSNPPASGTAGSFTLILTNGGSQTVNWPASVDWAGGTAPTLTTSGVDILTFLTVDGGTTWYGFAAGLDMS